MSRISDLLGVEYPVILGAMGDLPPDYVPLAKLEV